MPGRRRSPRRATCPRCTDVSTLLEALRKSERARRLGRAPAYREVGAPATSFALRWVSLIAVLALAAVLVWSGWLVTRPPVPVPASTPDVAAAASVASIPKPPEPVPVVTPGVRPPEAPAARRAPAATATMLSPVPSTRVDSRPARTLPETGEAPWLSELPAGFRDRLPPLVVNIHVYSPNVAQRILYINNRPCRPGQEIDGGVVVEDILPDGVLLRFDNQRFRLPRPT